ncbi:unnamed protein product [Pieris brassicae]|uniref:TIL domain-containing protein n=1 Tax=Pieris brassicae TaxID=7116 RepID=A0A9P0X7P1_PIEBR|nr:unnamed protein product [Pieris brassicae]
MTYLRIFSVLSVFLAVVLGAPNCSIDEVLDSCPSDCAYDYCPKDEKHDRTPCLKPTQCTPDCKCAFNYRRYNGTCIPTTECPPFACTRKNEYFEPCPLYCPGEDCSSATPTGECPFLLLIAVNCSPSCRCLPGYWRKDGICVPYEECHVGD